jgi:L-ascorbate metabolism protein UlaG (beta-lactamase superfamily)
MMSWRRFANWAKHKPLALRVADRLGRSRGRLAVIDRLNPPPPPRLKIDFNGWNDHDLAAAWVGHATVVLRLGGKTILTDPVFSHRVGIGMGLLTAGPRRLVAAAVTVRDLPKIDLILLSHAHFDHLDRPTLARLPRHTPMIVAAQTRDLVADLGFRHIRETTWGQSVRVGRVTIATMQAQHWGARTFHDEQRTYNSYLLRDDAGHSVFFGGDTAHTHAFDGIGPIDLAILGIGAYDPYVAAHATPEQAWLMAQAMPARHFFPMHHSTFRLSQEPTAEPLQRLLAAAGDNAHQVVVREVGGMWSLPEKNHPERAK